MSNDQKQRPAILDSISSWLKLLGLIVLAVEAILIIALVNTSPQDPQRVWYIPLMLIFFSIIVIGLFFDRYIEIRAKTNKQSRVMVSPKGSSNIQEGSAYLEVSPDLKLKIVLAKNIALISSELRQESYEKIGLILQEKIRVHRFIFEYPTPSALLPVNDRYFGRFSWDNHEITCHELFQIPQDSDFEHWGRWTKLQSLYVEAFSTEYRRPNQNASKGSLRYAATQLKSIHSDATVLIASKPELNIPGISLLLSRLETILENLDYSDKSKSANNIVVQLETALSTAHDLIKKLMPRVVSV